MNQTLFYIFPNKKFIDLGLYQFGREQCKPGHSFGPATRNHYLFHYIISGTGTLMADNSKGESCVYNIKSGQGFLIYPGQITTYIADKDIPWEYTWIEFDGIRVNEALSVTELSLDNPVFHANSRETRDKMRDEMLYIATHADESPLNLIGHLYLFFDYFTSACRNMQIKETSKMSDFYIKEAINFIEQNFQNDISVEDIADVCGINRSYLGKIFRKSIGRSPQEFLINYRMVKATELLQTTSLSVGDISNAVGYSNQLHFSRAFKNEFGVSPRQWRYDH